MVRKGRDLYDGTYVWLAFCEYDDTDPFHLREACSSLTAAKQSLDERLRCYDLRDSTAGAWQVHSQGADGPRQWRRTASRQTEPGNIRSWQQTIKREPVRRELSPEEL